MQDALPVTNQGCCPVCQDTCKPRLAYAHVAEGEQHNATTVRVVLHDCLTTHLVKREGSKFPVAWEGHNKPVP